LTSRASYAKLVRNQTTMNARTAAAILGAMSVSLIAFAKDVDPGKLPPASDRPGVTYEKDIKPILDKSCVKCHSGEKPKAKLHLDSLAGALKGGADGKVLEPGNSAKSMLVINVARAGDKEDWMPPPNNKANIPPLTKEQIGLIRAWIDQGAR
jgi:hypothetical protein